MNKLQYLERRVLRYRKLLIVAFALWVVFYVGGMLTGWWVVKGRLGSFPQVDATTRLLVIAPHPDDEVLTSGGLIQRVLSSGGKVEVLFLTNGDGSKTSVIEGNKKVSLSPDQFITLGETRMTEALASTAILGVNKENVLFLGFPDEGLESTYARHFYAVDKAYSSPNTKVDHVPYQGVLHPSQAYLGENLLSDVKEVISSFSPTMVVTTHEKDSHPDHRIAFTVTTAAKKELNLNFSIYESIVHYKGYPNAGGYLFPPKKLFGGGWVSLELTPKEILTDRSAIEAHESQYSKFQDKYILNALTARNEIFETE